MASTALKINKEKWKAKYILQEMKTESDIKTSLAKTAAQVGLSVLAGGAVGAALGKPAFFAGLGLTFLGYYKDLSWLPPIGIGMMASSHILPVNNSVSGFDLKTEAENAKTRLLNFKDTLFQKTYLDKIIKPKADTNSETTEGIGTLEESNQALNHIEQQLVNTAMEYKSKNGGSTSGLEEEMQGTEEPDFSGF
jgi:hypothetical protein